MIFKNVANQKLPLYLQDSSGNPKAGEAANITAHISVDGGTPQTVTGVTEIGGGFYYITPSQAQTNGHLLTWWGVHPTYICRGGVAFTSDAYTQARAQALDNLDAAVADAVVAEITGSNLVNVVVQPLVANVLRPSGDGGTIEAWAEAKLTAAWSFSNTNLTGHDLRLIVYNRFSPYSKVAEYSGSEVTITYTSPDTAVSITGADSKTPDAGNYRYVLRDMTTDTVLISGVVVVNPAPDAA